MHATSNPTGPAAAINCKLQIGNSGLFHRFALQRGAGAGFAALEEKLRAVAGTIPQWGGRLGGDVDGLLIMYRDDEDDWIRLQDDADLQMALGFGDTLRLAIRPRRNPAIHSRCAVRAGPGGGATRGWHRWAMERYGAAPARRLAAAAGIDCKAAVGKLTAAMHGNPEALQFVEANMSKATPAPEPGTAGHGHRGARQHRRHQPLMGQRLFSCRAGPAHRLAQAFGVDLEQAWGLIKQAHAGDEAAKAKLELALGKMKAKFGEAAADAMGVDQAEAWDIMAKAKNGDAAAGAKVGTAVAASVKSALGKHPAAADHAPDATPSVELTVDVMQPNVEDTAPANTGPVGTTAPATAELHCTGDPETQEIQQTLDTPKTPETMPQLPPVPPPFEFPEALAMLTQQMGFEETAAKAALLSHRGNTRLAVSDLIG